MKENRNEAIFLEKFGMNSSLITYQAWKTKTKATLG